MMMTMNLQQSNRSVSSSLLAASGKHSVSSSSRGIQQRRVGTFASGYHGDGSDEVWSKEMKGSYESLCDTILRKQQEVLSFQRRIGSGIRRSKETTGAAKCNSDITISDSERNSADGEMLVDERSRDSVISTLERRVQQLKRRNDQYVGLFRTETQSRARLLSFREENETLRSEIDALKEALRIQVKLLLRVDFITLCSKLLLLHWRGVAAWCRVAWR